MDYTKTINGLAREEARRLSAKFGYQVIDPEDVAQDALIVVLQDPDNIETKDNPGGWLRGIVRNKALQAVDARLRCGKETIVDFTPDIYDHGDHPGLGAFLARTVSDPTNVEDLVTGTSLLEDAEAMLEGLLSETLKDPRELYAARRYYLEGVEPKDIAEGLRVSHQVVKHLMSAARSRLGEVEGDLRAWRVAMFPEARIAKSDATPAKNLLALVGGSL